MRESAVEKYLVKRVREVGGEAFKWVSPSTKGVPDRLVVLPQGKVIAVELKASRGGRLSALQKHQHGRLESLGMTVAVLSSKASIDAFLQEQSCQK